DISFHPVANDIVQGLAVQADGKILVRGNFTALGGQLRSHFGRVNADGTIDLAFDPSPRGGDVASIALQADGRILLGGSFTNLTGQSRNHIGRLNADGSLDMTF